MRRNELEQVLCLRSTVWLRTGRDITGNAQSWEDIYIAIKHSRIIYNGEQEQITIYVIVFYLYYGLYQTDAVCPFVCSTSQFRNSVYIQTSWLCLYLGMW